MSNSGAAIIVGVWLVIAGAVAVLAGLTGARRRRRLRATGQMAWGMVLPPRAVSVDADPVFAHVSVQYELPDGRVIERLQARPGRARASWQPGQRVLVWYDPADPGDVVVYGSDGRWSDRLFIAVGAVAVVAGTILAGFA